MDVSTVERLSVTSTVEPIAYSQSSRTNRRLKYTDTLISPFIRHFMHSIRTFETEISDILIWNNTEIIAYIGAITFLLYEAIHGFSDELEYIWRGTGWSIAKLLYMITHVYCPLYLSIDFALNLASESIGSLPMCIAYFLFHACAGQIIIITSVDLIFVFRVSALYRNNRRIVLALGLGIILQLTIWLYVILLIALRAATATGVMKILPNLNICVRAASDSHVKLENACYGISLVFHTILFLLTMVYAGRDLLNDHQGLRIMSRNDRYLLAPVLSSVLRDGTIFFGIVFVTTLLNVISINARGGSFVAVMGPVYNAILPYSGSQLILRLRKSSHLHESSSDMVSQSIFFARSAERANRVPENADCVSGRTVYMSDTYSM